MTGIFWPFEVKCIKPKGESGGHLTSKSICQICVLPVLPPSSAVGPFAVMWKHLGATASPPCHISSQSWSAESSSTPRPKIICPCMLQHLLPSFKAPGGAASAICSLSFPWLSCSQTSAPPEELSSSGSARLINPFAFIERVVSRMFSWTLGGF